jgi:hypothetical protein
VIVRISGEGRWRLPDELAPRLIDDELRVMRAAGEAAGEQDESEYRYLLLALCRYVRQCGVPLPNAAQAAHMTIPSPAMTLEETVAMLAEPPTLW